MSILSDFVASPSSKYDNYIFTSTNYSDSPLRSPTTQKVALGAIKEDQEFSTAGHGTSSDDSPFKMCLSMSRLRRPTTLKNVSLSIMMKDIITTEVKQKTTLDPKMSYATNASIDEETHAIDTSKLMQVPKSTAIKAKRTKHRRSNCVFV